MKKIFCVTNNNNSYFRFDESISKDKRLHISLYGLLDKFLKILSL